jgi:hypothetical protein
MLSKIRKYDSKLSDKRGHQKSKKWRLNARNLAGLVIPETIPTFLLAVPFIWGVVGNQKAHKIIPSFL